MTVTQTFWGDASGPGPDPADVACAGGVGPVTVESVATAEIKVVPSAQR